VIESAATGAAVACEAIEARFAVDERRLPEGEARRLLWRLAEGALPTDDVPQAGPEALRALRESRLVKVVAGLFGDAIVFHVGLARIVAGPRGRV